MRVAVIGGGPSGLVTLKYLIKAHLSLSCDPIEAWLFESEDTIGGAFAHRAYEDAELVSSKQLTTFSDFRCPRNEDFLSAVDYVRYLQDYCSKFQLWGNIKLESTIQGIKGSRAQGYVIEYVNKSGEVLSWKCDAIAVCSGLHREPNMPVIPGLNHVPQVLHSADFKTKNVSRANLFDTTYVHRTLRNSMILWEYYNYYIKALLWICSGTTAGMDQWIGAISPARHHPSKIFFNKSMKICPYLSLPYRPKQPDFRHQYQTRMVDRLISLSEMQAQLWVLNLVAPYRLSDLKAEDETHYKLHSGADARVHYGVDHESYAYQLALDIGSAPGVVDIWRVARQTRVSVACRILIIWAFGAHFNTKFRMIGPWAWKGAKELLATDEFWQTISRRPILFGHFFVSILPMMIFGPLSMLFLIGVSLPTYWNTLELYLVTNWINPFPRV
ncbi:dimethylaniline monooxygenase [Fusarium langsethiae]|uniref:Dimethylaniline monooxygenase n=1 Tax=Fusarium langsethiae TaxID=179993 RepID=A0A0M9ET05_FUSLA|nr:dimethylaniline monooxygenase [Fusarium langsethiae]